MRFWPYRGALAAARPSRRRSINSKGLRKAVTVQGIREHQQALQGIAKAERGTRASGTPGYDASVAYVVAAPRGRGLRRHGGRRSGSRSSGEQHVEFERISPSPRVFRTPAEFSTMTYSGSGTPTANATAVDPGERDSGCEARTSPASRPANIALIKRGTCPFADKAINAQTAGASAVMIFNNVGGPLTARSARPGQNIPVIGTLRAIGNELVSADRRR